jgi:hypothetical protein
MTRVQLLLLALAKLKPDDGEALARRVPLELFARGRWMRWNQDGTFICLDTGDPVQTVALQEIVMIREGSFEGPKGPKGPEGEPGDDDEA